MITILDYGMGNLRSVRRAFEEIGCKVRVTNEAGGIERAERIVLPGVGAFGEAVRRIDGMGIRQSLRAHIGRGTPVLGICLGMQLLFESSEESPGAAGLAVLRGRVKRFGTGLKVPHVGWNDVHATRTTGLLGGAGRNTASCFYFVHSYYVPSSEVQVGVTGYGVRFASVVQHGNVLGVQFHPEKSQAAGLALLRTWAESDPAIVNHDSPSPPARA